LIFHNIKQEIGIAGNSGVTCVRTDSGILQSRHVSEQHSYAPTGTSHYSSVT